MKGIRFLFPVIFLIIFNIESNSQEKDYSLARVGEKIHGVYIFLLESPLNEYEFIATIKVKADWSGSREHAFEKAIKKAKKKYPYFNGMIFQKPNLREADLIIFKGLGVSRGGFKIGDKVTFIEYDKLNYGEVAVLGSSKNKAGIKYIDINGNEKIKEIKYSELTSISEEDYQARLAIIKKKHTENESNPK